MASKHDPWRWRTLGEHSFRSMIVPVLASQRVCGLDRKVCDQIDEVRRVRLDFEGGDGGYISAWHAADCRLADFDSEHQHGCMHAEYTQQGNC